MAQGDLLVFEEAMGYMFDGGWEAADAIWLAITSDTPTAADEVPGMDAGATTTYAPIATAGEYEAGGQLLCSWDAFVVEADGVVTATDTGATATWAQNGASPQNGKYGVVYNTTDGLERAICFIDLNNTAVVDMQAGPLTITWDVAGMFTVTKA
jgi:hypothetical protein